MGRSLDIMTDRLTTATSSEHSTMGARDLKRLHLQVQADANAESDSPLQTLHRVDAKPQDNLDKTSRRPVTTDAPDTEYPPALQVAIIMMCILSAIFLMSLVGKSLGTKS